MNLGEKSARPAPSGPEFAHSEAAHLPAEFFVLLQQIGSSEVSEFAVNTPVGEGFLQIYLTKLLLPVELPAIAEACGHALRGELRELIAQDQLLNERIGVTPFSVPSQRMGRVQLARLHPLRDDRLVQRYLAAVKSGKANGWHTIVYGVTLALYSLPLRQGLLHYAQETLTALAKNIPGADADARLDALMAQVPEAVESTLTRC